MHHRLHAILIICNVLAAVLSVLWLIDKWWDYEPAIVLILAVAGAAALLHTKRKRHE
ncbi:MAG: hypothetical protein K8I03_04325 [Ignavibacteria bacterium]|nr:hypothetical protein [Ignavibacteria bacterium]